MRDIAVTLICLYGWVATLKKPYYGVLLWSWLSYMSPHRLCFGFALNAPLAQITAIVLVASIFLSKEEKKMPWNFLSFVWIAFIVFMGVTTFNAFFVDAAYDIFDRTVKTQLVIFLTMLLIDDRKKLDQLIWLVVLSIGYFSVKGGIFTLLTGGGFRVYGPEGTYIEDNNALAIAVLMVVPLMSYLYQTHAQKWVKQGLLFAIVFSLFTVLGSQSRGAFIAIIAVGAFYWFKSKSKIGSGLVITILALALLAFAPAAWYERMHTINEYEQDGSAMGRINAWIYAYRAANANVLGMGYDSWSPQTFAMYAPNPTDVHAAHSIYFSVLADHGWIGLGLFLLIIFLTWRLLVRVIKQTAKNEQLKHFNILARMIQVSFIAYLSGGTFLSLAYYDLPWLLVGLVIIIDKLVNEESAVQVPGNLQKSRAGYGWIQRGKSGLIKKA